MSETIESTSSSLRFSKPLSASATMLFTSSTLMSFSSLIEVPRPSKVAYMPVASASSVAGVPTLSVIAAST